MNVRWVFNRCDAFKEQARSHWQREMPRIARLLARWPADQREMRITLYRLEQPDISSAFVAATRETPTAHRFCAPAGRA